MSNYNLNMIYRTGQSSIYNLDIDIVNSLQIYLLPTKLSIDVDGYNEVDAKKSWLLQPKLDSSEKISIIVDGSVIPIKIGEAGESATNPITFTRSASPLPIDVEIYGVDNTIFPLYGNDSTEYGDDWLRKINNKTTTYEYFLNHNINKDFADYVTFDVIINETNGSGLYNLIQSKLLDATFVVHTSIYDKPTVNGFDIMAYKKYSVYKNNEFNIRF